MRSDEFVGQLLTLGERLHEHDGVWWRQHGPFYWKPALEFLELEPGRAKPATRRAWVGYSHLVPPASGSNRSAYYMVFEAGAATPFTLDSLTSKKRNQVRKGLRCCEIRRIGALEPVLADLQRINISARRRTGAGLPADYYVKKYERWRRRMLSLFALPGRDWWGAFVGTRLVAYFFSYAVDDTLIIDAAKSETDFLTHNPSDALLYTLMEDALNAKRCRRIIYGGWTPNDDRLTEFKEKYGFQKTEFRAFVKLTPVAESVLRFRERLRRG